MDIKKVVLMLFLVLIVITSLNSISATENQTIDSPVTDTETTNMETDTQVNEDIVESSTKTYTDLFNDLNNKTEFTLTDDYVFDNSKDAELKTGIVLFGKSLAINGNNHIIDAKNSTLFVILYSNISIKNLTIKNANNSALYADNSNLTTSDVIFENNLADLGGAIRTDNSNYTSNNDKFLNNHALQGTSINSDNTTLTINGSEFINSNDYSKAILEVSNSKILLNNTKFLNSTSKYSTAIFITECEGKILNTEFENLRANMTGGAIIVKTFNKTLTFDNCTFSNVTSTKNGGAMFVDVYGGIDINETPTNNGTVNIFNSKFKDCNSDFGGAYLQLGGKLCMDNVIFINNTANYDGGSIYTSYAFTNISKSIFENNNANNDYGQGGAIYFDKAILSIDNSTFIENNALDGGALLIYDSEYSVSDTTFKSNQENIHTYFDSGLNILKDNVYVDGKNINNDTNYLYVYEGEGIPIDYNPVILDESLVNASKFNLVDYGLVTSVKHQGFKGSCWAFGVAGSLESAYLKATNRKVNIDISENNILNNAIQYSKYGVMTGEGAIGTIAASYFTSWMGVISVEDDTYDEFGKIGPILDNGTKYHIYDYIYLPSYKSDLSDIQSYKEALVKYGAIGVVVDGEAAQNSGGFNNKTNAAYSNRTSPNHYITLVGWDDNFSKDNFLITPPKDGAWILKNTWGSDWANNGYYYVSYYDKTFANTETIMFQLNNTYNFEKNYQYDLILNLTFKSNKNGSVTYANKFESIDDDLLAAVGTLFNESEVKYTINIVSGNELYTQEGVSTHAGYETIPLNSYVPIKKSENFTVMITSNNVPLSKSRSKIPANSSGSDYGGNWMDLSGNDTVACIKAYTIQDHSKVVTYNMTASNSSGEYLEVQFYGAGSEKLNNTKVEYSINNQIYEAITDNDAKIRISTNLPAGKYIVTIINPINHEKTSVTLTITSNDNRKENNCSPKHYTHTIAIQSPAKSLQKNTYKIIKDDKIVEQTNAITLRTLNNIFNQTFINGHLIVYIDGKLVFNDTVTENLSTVILKIIEKYLGTHEIKIEFTDNTNDTKTFTQNITIK